MSIKLLNRVAGALAAALIASPVIAADETTNEDEPVMEEIIVTATYRDTRLMDTPLAISAVTSEDMVAKGIEDIRTLHQSIPGLAYRGGIEANAQLSIRGITPSAQEGSVGAVGVYLDNQPISDSAAGGRNTNGSLFDMNRVEVLKGPQGTLYGEGNMGGSIRYITNKPDTSGLDYHVKSSIESSSKSDDLTYRIDAMVNIPLADQLALRLVGYRRDLAGVLDTPAPRNEKDVDTTEENGLRAALKWDASETFEVTAMANVVDSEFGGPQLAFHCYTEWFNEGDNDTPGGRVPGYLAGTGGTLNNAAPDSPCLPGKTDTFDHGDPYVTHLGHLGFVNEGYDENTNYNLTIDWELPFADLISSTSYFEREVIIRSGESPPTNHGLFRFLPFLLGSGPSDVQTYGFGGSPRFTERVVQELRLISNSDGPLQWTLGAYYKDDESRFGFKEGPCYKGGGGPDYAALDFCPTAIFGYAPHVTAEQRAGFHARWFAIFARGLQSATYLGFGEKAIYGEVSYRLSDQWEILFGLRVAEVENQQVISRPGVESNVDPIFDLTKASDITSPKATLTWRPIEDWMIFVTYSEGYRPGLINNRLVTKHAQLQLDVDNPELPDEHRAESQGHIDRTKGFLTVDGDFVENTELGIKASVLGGRLSFTSSYYHIAYEDYVLRVLDFFPSTFGGGFGRTQLQYGVNSGDATSRGLELEVRWAPTDNLLLTFGGDKSFEANIGLGEVPMELTVLGVTAGDRMSNAPRDSYYASLAYDFDLFGKNATARVDTYGLDGSLDSSLRYQKFDKPAYKTTDVKLMVDLDKWRLSAYVRNVTDERIATDFNFLGYTLGPPRTLGVQIHYRM